MRWHEPRREGRSERRERRALSAPNGSVRGYEDGFVSSCGCVCWRPPPGLRVLVALPVLAELGALGRGREGRV